MVNVQLICAFVFAYAKSRFSHDAAQLETACLIANCHQSNLCLLIVKGVFNCYISGVIMCPMAAEGSTNRGDTNLKGFNC